mgnify:CR=1 FL=1
MSNVIPLREEKPKPEVTICTHCVHFMNLDPGSPREHIWYNHLCKATPLPTKVDPYDGKTKAHSVNDLGGEYFTENQFQYCRNVNDGRCPNFQALEL